ncbi:MAG: hypothetical protein ABSE22_03265 [Xanthobacteraceae bacterium]|jgi:hypothetical protein
MSQAQRAVIALLLCLSAWMAWQDRVSWQYPVLPFSQQPHNQTTSATADDKDQPERLDWKNWTHDPIAVFTGALMLFNGLLFVSTIGLWLATRKSASISERALVDLERAYLFIEGIVGEGSNLIFYLDITANWNPKTDWPTFRFSLVNYGRTAGNIDFGLIRFEVLTQIPSEMTKTAALNSPEYSQVVEIIVGPDRPISWEGLKCEHDFTKEHGTGIRNGTSFLYCHGLFTYFDIFMKSHTIKFCRRYDPRSGDWAPDGGKERNYSN